MSLNPHAGEVLLWPFPVTLYKGQWETVSQSPLWGSAALAERIRAAYLRASERSQSPL